MKRTATLVLAVLAIALTSAHASTWTVDKNHSKIGFTVKHLTISTVRGEFKTYDATITYDPAKPEDLSFDATMDVNSISTENEKRDGHLKSPDFFDAANFPTATFKSKKTEKIDDGHLKVTGDLTIRGTTKEIVLDVQGLNQFVNTQQGRRTAAVATATINRFDYGLKWNAAIETGGLVADNMVNLVIEVELVESK